MAYRYHIQNFPFKSFRNIYSRNRKKKKKKKAPGRDGRKLKNLGVMVPKLILKCLLLNLAISLGRRGILNVPSTTGKNK